MDPDTISRAADGDAEALDAIFRRNLGPLVAFIRMKAGGIVTAQESPMDIAQSVCREVLQDFDQFECKGEKAFRNWLFLQATRKIINRHRFHRQARRDADRAVRMSDIEAQALATAYGTVATPTRFVAAREEVDRIEAAIARLPEDQRDAVMMSRVLHMDYAAIAERMERTESAVRGLVARGLATLAEVLGPRP